MATNDTRFGFPPTLLAALNDVMPGNATTCGMCGDTILGGRHRVIDAITERLSVGEVDTGDDYNIAPADLWIIVMASYEHDKALKRQRRAEKRVVRLPCPRRDCDGGGVGVDERDAREALARHAQEDHAGG